MSIVISSVINYAVNKGMFRINNCIINKPSQSKTEGAWGRAIFVTFVIDTLTKICKYIQGDKNEQTGENNQ